MICTENTAPCKVGAKSLIDTGRGSTAVETMPCVFVLPACVSERLSVCEFVSNVCVGGGNWR